MHHWFLKVFDRCYTLTLRVDALIRLLMHRKIGLTVALCTLSFVLMSALGLPALYRSCTAGPDPFPLVAVVIFSLCLLFIAVLIPLLVLSFIDDLGQDLLHFLPKFPRKRLPPVEAVLGMFPKAVRTDHGVLIPHAVHLCRVDWKTLPDCLEIQGGLIIERCKFRRLPKGLVVHDLLTVLNTPIRSVPKDLVAKKGLDLCNVLVRTLPCQSSAWATLSLTSTRIRRLPDGLVVLGDCLIAMSPIKRLPRRMRVGGNLHLIDSRIERLSPDLVTNGVIVPPTTLIDLQRLRHSLDAVEAFAPPQSGHQTLALRKRLHRFPDVVTVLLSGYTRLTVTPWPKRQAPLAHLINRLDQRFFKP